MNSLLNPSNTTLHRTMDAYANARLEDNASSYMGSEHRDELRDLSEITEWHNRPEIFVPGIGTIRPFFMATKQGYGYEGAQGIPLTQRSASYGLATSPLGTSAPGYNYHVLVNYMRAGNYVAFLAGEGSYRPQTSTIDKTRISLANTAAALLNLGYHTGQELRDEGHDIDEHARFTYGASRGGGIGLVLNALDSDFAQHIETSDIIAPSPTLKLDNIEHWKRIAEQLIREPARTIRILGGLGLRQTVRYRKSVSLNPYSLMHQMEICGGLFNGELSAAVNHIPADKIIRITEYDCDLACNDGGLEQQLTASTHPNVRFEQLPGIHMSIADRALTLPHMIGFNKAFQEYRVADIASPALLYERALELAPLQRPLTKKTVLRALAS